MKTCPYCKESDLQPDAIVCKHCQKDLPVEGLGGKTTWGWAVLSIFCFILGLFWFPLMGAAAVFGILYFWNTRNR
jgi:hypothetical protein